MKRSLFLFGYCLFASLILVAQSAKKQAIEIDDDGKVTITYNLPEDYRNIQKEIFVQVKELWVAEQSITGIPFKGSINRFTPKQDEVEYTFSWNIHDVIRLPYFEKRSFENDILPISCQLTFSTDFNPKKFEPNLCRAILSPTDDVKQVIVSTCCPKDDVNQVIFSTCCPKDDVNQVIVSTYCPKDDVNQVNYCSKNKDKKYRLRNHSIYFPLIASGVSFILAGTHCKRANNTSSSIQKDNHKKNADTFLRLGTGLLGATVFIDLGYMRSVRKKGKKHNLRFEEKYPPAKN